MPQEKLSLPHKLTLEEREKLTMTGATEIIHFDEEMTKLVTQQGGITVYGSGLKLKTLSLDGGTVAITGRIDAIVYDWKENSRGWSRLWK